MGKKIAVILTAGVLALGGASAAWAAIPDSDDGEFHACVKNSAGRNGHEVRIIDKQGGETCPSGWTEEVWSQTGPQGPEGPQGPQGPAPTFYTRSASFSVSANPDQDDVITGEKFCDAGDEVTGGGWELGTNPSPNVQVLASHQWHSSEQAHGWRVQVFNHSTTTAYELFVQIRCADIA